MKTVLATAAASVVLSVIVGSAADAGSAETPAPHAFAGTRPAADPSTFGEFSASQPLSPVRFASYLPEAASPPESPVADAAMRSDLETVRALVKQGADVNAAQGDGMTALHWAAQNGDVTLVEVLVYAGANPSAATRNGAYTPLHLAARAGNAQVAEALLQAGANPNLASTTGGATALHFAAGSGSAETVLALLNHDAEADARESAWQQTPLMWAAAYGYTPVVQALLEHGADVSAVSKVEDVAEREKLAREDEQRRERRMRALAAAANPEAAASSDDENPSALRSRGAPAERPSDGAKEKKEEDDNLSQDGTNLEVPLSYGDLVGNKGGLTPLLFAVRQGNAEAAMALIAGGADINQVSGDHTSPMLMATINGHFDLAQQLLERGADPNIASDGGATPLYAAINVRWAPKALYPQPVAHKQQSVDYLDFMETLLKAGADPNVRLKKHLWYMEYNFSLLQVDTKGATPFWRAAYATDVPAMKLLVEHGADPNIPTEKSPERRRRGGDDDKKDLSGLPAIPVGGPAVYPIHAASGVGFGEGYAANSHQSAPGGWLPAVKYLIEELGADVNARDHNGYNAIHHAAARGDNELIKYLMEQGGDVTAVSRRGQTTADMANGPVQRVPPFLDTVKLLESLGSKNNHNCQSC